MMTFLVFAVAAVFAYFAAHYLSPFVSWGSLAVFAFSVGWMRAFHTISADYQILVPLVVNATWMIFLSYWGVKHFLIGPKKPEMIVREDDIWQEEAA